MQSFTPAFVLIGFVLPILAVLTAIWLVRWSTSRQDMTGYVEIAMPPPIPPSPTTKLGSLGTFASPFLIGFLLAYVSFLGPTAIERLRPQPPAPFIVSVSEPANAPSGDNRSRNEQPAHDRLADRIDAQQREIGRLADTQLGMAADIRAIGQRPAGEGDIERAVDDRPTRMLPWLPFGWISLLIGFAILFFGLYLLFGGGWPGWAFGKSEAKGSANGN